MKKASVVIPFKDKGTIEQLDKAVLSLINQTMLPFEIILVGPVNDISLFKISFKTLPKKVLKLKFFIGDKNEARNIGILLAKGDFILYLDHDMRADTNLLEDCLKLSLEYDAIIIPERGEDGNFWANCRKLEKELIAYDLDTVTPRFFKKNIFEKGEKPFDNRFGLLDEWGFNVKIKNRNIPVGISKSFLTVYVDNISISREIKNKFLRGLWMKNFYQIDKAEAWARIDPFQRGIIFYTKRLHYFFKEPVYFLGLIFLKAIDFISFMAGYLISYFVKPRSDR